MEQRNLTFQALKPPCVRLSQAALSFGAQRGSSKDVVQALDGLLQTLSSVASRKDSLDEKLSDYVFFPLSHVLRESQKLPTRALEQCLLCMTILLETGWQKHIAISLSGQLLILLTFMADSGSAGKKLEQTSEELQVAAFRCLSLLFASLGQSRSGKESLTSTANVPQLGHTVTVMLDGVVNGVSNEIQLSALSALDSLLSCLLDHDVLTKFFPGIVSSLTKAVTPSTKSRRTYKLLEGALRLLKSLLVSVLGDAKARDAPLEVPGEVRSDSHPSLRTKSWLQATSGQVKQALANILRIWKHDREQVKQALSELCIVILQDCRNSLNDSASMTLETLVMLSDQESQTRRSGALKHLLSINPDLCELLRNSLRLWVLSLARVMQTNDDAAKQQLVHRIALAYQLLSEQATDLTNIDMTLATSLRNSITLAVKDSRAEVKNNSNDVALAFDGIESTYDDSAVMVFHDVLEGRRSQVDTIIEVKTLLKCLSASSSAESLVQDLLQFCDDSAGEVQVASLWLAVQSLKGMTEQASLISEYINFGDSVAERQGAFQDQLYAISIDVLTYADKSEEYDWRAQALALEAVALQAEEKKQDFREELIDALYPVVHLVGSSIPALRRHAITCLNILASACGYANAADLIISNADYLTNAVAFKLSGPEISPQAPVVLLMMIRLSGPTLIPYLDDVTENIFVALEQYHGYPRLVELLFTVLRAVAEESVKASQLSITDRSGESDQCSLIQPINVSEIIADIQKLKLGFRTDEGDIVEEVPHNFPKQPWKDSPEKPGESNSPINGISLPASSEEDNELPPDEPLEPGPPAPRTYNMLLNISQLTQHYLPSSSSQFRAVLLSLLDTAIPVIATHENSFLPLINTLWPVLASRLDDSEAYVVASAFKTIGLLCKHAGQFMKGRIEDIWPKVMDLYEQRILRELNGGSEEYRNASQESQSAKALVLRDLGLEQSPMATYVDTPTRVLWSAIVHAFTLFAQHVPASEEVFDDILLVLGPLLEEQRNIRSVLEQRNPDAVWLAMVKRSHFSARTSPRNDRNYAMSGRCLGIPPLLKKPLQNELPFVDVV
ncbi:MAG: hypothetical protein M1821_001597 [Bathelium mastoideum]|nr:MAG: hypothetical protein M1821_001597 [Bathelium mastoideum]